MATLIELNENFTLDNVTGKFRYEDTSIPVCLPEQRLAYIPLGKTGVMTFHGTLNQLVQQFVLRFSDWKRKASNPEPYTTVDQFTTGSAFFRVPPVASGIFTDRKMTPAGLKLRALELPSYNPIEVGTVWRTPGWSLAKVLPERLGQLLPELERLSTDEGALQMARENLQHVHHYDSRWL